MFVIPGFYENKDNNDLITPERTTSTFKRPSSTSSSQFRSNKWFASKSRKSLPLESDLLEMFKVEKIYINKNLRIALLQTAKRMNKPFISTIQ